MPEFYISCDIRTSGPIPSDYSILSLGMTVCGNDSQEYIININPLPGSKHDQGYLETARLTWKDVTEPGWGVDPKEAMTLTHKWIKGVSGTQKPILVSWNVLDYMFIRWYFMHFLGTDPFSGRYLDMKSMLMGRAGIDYSDSTERYLSKRGLTTSKHTSNPLDESRLQAALFQQIRDHNFVNGR